MALEDRAVRRSPEPLLDSGARVSDDRVLPRFDLHHVDEDRAVDGHAPFGTPAGDERGAGACDESLRWHATRIHASSSKALTARLWPLASPRWPDGQRAKARPVRCR